jgi:outer membrane autotransporter protein
MPVAAAIYARNLLSTLHERMGGDAEMLDAVPQGSSDGTPDGAWSRIIGFWGHHDGDPRGIYGGEPEFDYRFGALQLGADLFRMEDLQDGSRDNAGLYAAFGHGQLDVTHNLLGRTFKGGDDTLDAWSIGGYWTHFGPSGWYVDGILQGTWYDVSMTGARGLRDGETNGLGFAASIEGGYPFDLGQGWVIEPQAQLVYQALDFDDFNDGAADVRYSDLDSLAGRVGAWLARSWDLEEAQGDGPGSGDGPAPVRSASAWLRVDVWHEFLGQPTTAFSSANGFVPFTSDLQGSWVKVGLGGSWDMTEAATVHGNVNYDVTFDGDAQAWEGKLGFKVKW